MGPSLTVRPSAALSRLQFEALTSCVPTLPATWNLTVYGDTVTSREAHRFTVRIVGPRFVAISPFGPATRPEQLTAFVEKVLREHAGGT
jgi:hypothetical protein